MIDPNVLAVGGERYTVRRARRADLPQLVAMLADDAIGATRESSPAQRYERAFALVDGDPHQHLVVLETADGELAGTLQLSLIPGISRGGTVRGQIEAVRVHAAMRGRGLGGPFVQWAIDEARRRGATLVQLTTDSARVDAHRFYERLGFVASHVGYKLDLA